MKAESASKSAPDDSVVCEIEIAAPPERVFQALTDAKQLFEWWGKEPTLELLSFDMDAHPGGRWSFHCKPAAGEAGEHHRRDGTQEFEVHGEILECVPPRLLVWSWIASWHEQPTRVTTVRWELLPAGKGTRVRVTHSGLTHEPVSRKGYAGGWQGVLRLLGQYLDKP